MRILVIFLLWISASFNALACGYSPPSIIRLTQEHVGVERSLLANDLIEVRLPGSVGDGWRSTVKPEGAVKITKIEHVTDAAEAQSVLYFEASNRGSAPFKLSIKNVEHGKTYKFFFVVRPTPLSGACN
jgi:hypothetical protein